MVCSNPKPFPFVTWELSDMEAVIHSDYMLQLSNYTVSFLSSSSRALRWMPPQPCEFCTLWFGHLFLNFCRQRECELNSVPRPYKDFWYRSFSELVLTDYSCKTFTLFFCSDLISYECSCCTMANFWLWQTSCASWVWRVWWVCYLPLPFAGCSCNCLVFIFCSP